MTSRQWEPRNKSPGQLDAPGDLDEMLCTDCLVYNQASQVELWTVPNEVRLLKKSVSSKKT
jgi:hypothetical protein